MWVEAGGRLDSELNYVEETLGSFAGGVNQMVIQTANGGESFKNGESFANGGESVGEGGSLLLTPDSMLRHLEILRRATRVTVQRDDV